MQDIAYQWQKGNWPEQRDETLYREFFTAHPQVFLYGAGHGAKAMMAYLKSLGLQAAGIVVGDGQEHAVELEGLSVKEMHEVTMAPQDGIIVTLKEVEQPAVEEYLVQQGIARNGIFCQKLYYRCTGEIDTKKLLPDVSKTGPYFATYHDLEDIGRNEGTDKCSDWHDYLHKYEFFLRRFREQAMTLLELGVFHGDSLRMWGRYFPQAKIIGVDIDPSCLQYQGGNCDVIIKDLSQIKNLESLKACQPTVIVDDASHCWSHQIKALFTLWDVLPHGGIYILEDLETGFDSYRDIGYDDAPVSAYDVSAAIAEVATSKEYLRKARRDSNIYQMEKEIERIGGEMDMITFIHGSCIMIKS